MVTKSYAASLAVICLAALGCRQAAAVLFDIPPREPQPQTIIRAAPNPAIPYLQPADTIVPDIERTLDPDSAVEALPRDHAGNIDWMRALRDGTIRPRASLQGHTPRPPNPFEFKFDFFFSGPDTLFDAYFPHSAHTEWLDCQQCHSRIFPYRNTEFGMADVFQGRFCGECHGKVAFPVLTGCERCHVSLQQPADRAQPELLGSIRLRRVTSDTAVAMGDVGNAGGVNTAELPNALFRHWVHRIRYKCKVCHMAIFEPEAGANEILMRDIAAGEACGQCHDGTTAFRAGFGQCERCHVQDEET